MSVLDPTDHVTVIDHPVLVYDMGYGDKLVEVRKTVKPKKGLTIATVKQRFDEDELVKLFGEDVVCKLADIRIETADDSDAGKHALIDISDAGGTAVQRAGPIQIPCRIPLYHRKWDVNKLDTDSVGVFGAIFSTSLWLPILSDVAASTLDIVLKGIFGPRNLSLPRLVSTFIPSPITSSPLREIQLSPAVNPYKVVYRDSGVLNGHTLQDVCQGGAYCRSKDCTGEGRFTILTADMKAAPDPSRSLLLAYKIKTSDDLGLRGIRYFEWSARRKDSSKPPGARDWVELPVPYHTFLVENGVFTEFGDGSVVYLRENREYQINCEVPMPQDRLAGISELFLCIDFNHFYVSPGTTTNV